ncbi:WXG100 family type VII secretion target, partial [Peterkaempfera griseoplana]|uniref:WXG100 family type VII secretion target n=1 Tax=Peterkaempfera griseoplana TaxID=66896 RepID=UPI0006E31C64
MAEEYLRTARSETIEPATRAAAAQRIGTVVPTLPDTPVAPTATGDGSAGSGFQVVPEQYTAAVNPLHSMADQLSEMYTSLNSFLSQFDKPWGDDHAGKQFAEGDKGYIKYSTDILTVLKNLPKELRDTADGIKFMADNYEATEQAVVSGLTGQDQDLESTQGNYWSPSGYSYGTEISSTAVSGPGYSMTSPDSLYDPVVADSPVTPRYESAGVPMETAQIPVEPR